MSFLATPTVPLLVAENQLKPIRVDLGSSASITFFPNENEMCRLPVNLVTWKDGRRTVSKSALATQFSAPSEFIHAKLKGTDKWLVVGIESLDSGYTSDFCVLVDPKRSTMHLVVAGDEGVDLWPKALHRGEIYETDITKWIFPGHVSTPDSNDLWRRKGVLSSDGMTMRFGRWHKIRKIRPTASGRFRSTLVAYGPK